MSGITSGTGVFSGINTSGIIEQLLALDARPRTTAQNRIKSIQQQQAAFLVLNTQMNSLKAASSGFATNNTFRSAQASSSDGNVISAVASPGATTGSYQFLVDRLVATQQSLSRGFSDSTINGVGARSVTIETAAAKLSRETNLSQLNGGAGIERGRIIVTNSAGTATTVDLSRVATVTEALAVINDSGARVTARVNGDKLELVDNAAGSGTLTVANATGFNTATSLGIAGSAAAAGSGGTLTGSVINKVGGATSLASFNDGLGVTISTTGGLANPDFVITARSGQAFSIDIGDMYESVVPSGGGPAVITKTKSAVSDLQGVIDRINEQARVGSVAAVRAQVSADGRSLELVDLTTPSGPSATTTVTNVNASRPTATELGIARTSATGTVTGRPVLAGINSVLTRNVMALVSEDYTVNFHLREGTDLEVPLNGSGSISDLIASVATATGGKVTAALNQRGTGLVFTDTTTGSSPFAAEGLGQGPLTATSDGKLTIANMQMQYVGNATRLDTLNGGRGVGRGRFELINSYGQRSTVNISSETQTMADVVGQINAVSDVRARINSNGDGIEILEVPRAGGAGGQRISIRDLSGTSARDLNLVGTAAATGVGNKINGSYERTVTLLATDTLRAVSDKLNEANVGVVASIVNDGGTASARPFRLSLASRTSGTAGGFIMDSDGVDFGFTEVSRAENSRVFFGSADPARALLMSASSNTLPDVAQGLTLTVKAASSVPVSISVSQDTTAVETAVNEFVKTFNSLADRIDSLTKFDADARTKGVLLGNATVLQIRQSMFAVVQGSPTGVTGRYQNLAQVGVSINREGNLEVNSATLRDKMREDPQAVAALFSARGAVTGSTQQPVVDRNGNTIPGVFVNTRSTATITQQGIGERLAAAMEKYIKPIDGVLVRAGKTLDDQIKAQTDVIRTVDLRVGNKRLQYQRQYARMEEAIGRLQGQQGSIGNIRSI